MGRKRERQVRLLFVPIVVTGFAAQERLRWKWRQSRNSTSANGDTTTTAVAQALLNFLDTHLLAREPSKPAETTDSPARDLSDQRPRGYTVEVHHPALGGGSAAVKPGTEACSLD